MQTHNTMIQPKTTYDVKRLTLDELRIWLLSQNIKLPPAHKNQQSLHGLRELAFKQLAEIKKEKQRIAARNEQITLRMRDRAVATREAVRIMFSQASASDKSTGCIPSEKKPSLVPAVKVSSDGSSFRRELNLASPTSSTPSLLSLGTSSGSSTPKSDVDQPLQSVYTKRPISGLVIKGTNLPPRHSQDLVRPPPVSTSAGDRSPSPPQIVAAVLPATPHRDLPPLSLPRSLSSDPILIGAEDPLPDSPIWLPDFKPSPPPVASRSAPQGSKPWAMTYSALAGKPIAPILSSSYSLRRSASQSKPNRQESLPNQTRVSSSLEPEENPTSPLPTPGAVLSTQKKTQTIKDQLHPSSCSEGARSSSGSSEHKPLLLVDNQLYGLQAETFSGAEEVPTSEIRSIDHRLQRHALRRSLSLDQQRPGRAQEFSVRTKVESVPVLSGSVRATPAISPRKARTEMKPETKRAAHAAPQPRRIDTTSRVSSRSLSSTSTGATRSSVQSSNTTSPVYSVASSSSSDQSLNPLEWRGQTWAIVACVAAVFSILLLAQYKHYLEEQEKLTYWWT